MQRIRNGLYITDIDTLSTTQLPAGTENVVSVCQDTVPENVPQDVRYWHVPLADDEQSVERWGGSCSSETFVRAAHSALIAFHYGPTVIHCHHGKNRSAAICAVLMVNAYEGDTSLHEALDELRRIRPEVDVNETMMEHAARFVNNAV